MNNSEQTGNPKYIAVLDFEATCDNGTDPNWDPNKQEIIEFPVVLIEVESKTVIDTFHSMVQPTIQPKLTDFCTELTSITQQELAGQPVITVVVDRFYAWVTKHKLHSDNYYLLTCGDWDLQKMWSKQVALCSDISNHRLFQRWINIKHIFKEIMGRKAPGMMGMLEVANIQHVGVHHRGIDDVKNIVQLVFWLLSKGSTFSLTWTDLERQKEYDLLERRCKKKQRAVEHAQIELNRLPSSTSEEIRRNKQEKLVSFIQELSFLRQRQKVFDLI